MSKQDKQRNKAKPGALVLVSSPSAARPAFDNPSCFAHGVGGAAADLHVAPARSTFLAQLSAQYETRSEATKRRAQTRAEADRRYQNPTEKSRLRHLVWA